MPTSFCTALLLLFSLVSFGQKGKFNPFKLIVIKPDTAIIDKSLYGDIDSVQSLYQQRYYNSLKQMEEMLDFKDYSKEMEAQYKQMQENLKKAIPEMKAHESEVKKFKYFQTLSTYSAEIYSLYFNEYEPYSRIVEIPHQNTGIPSLQKLADTANADYIVFFSNVHTESKDILKLTTSLYSKKDKKIILTKETEGDTNSRGEKWTCGTPLLCLLINGVRTSSDAVAPEIAKRQMRK